MVTRFAPERDLDTLGRTHGQKRCPGGAPGLFWTHFGHQNSPKRAPTKSVRAEITTQTDRHAQRQTHKDLERLTTTNRQRYTDTQRQTTRLHRTWMSTPEQGWGRGKPL